MKRVTNPQNLLLLITFKKISKKVFSVIKMSLYLYFHNTANDGYVCKNLDAVLEVENV